MRRLLAVVGLVIVAASCGGASASPLTSEESSWCAANRDRGFAAVAETDEVGPPVEPGAAELFEFWTTDEWLIEPRESWSERERESYDRMCRAALLSVSQRSG